MQDIADGSVQILALVKFASTAAVCQTLRRQRQPRAVEYTRQCKASYRHHCKTKSLESARKARKPARLSSPQHSALPLMCHIKTVHIEEAQVEADACDYQKHISSHKYATCTKDRCNSEASTT